MGVSDIRAGAAFIELYAKDNLLAKGLAAGEKKLQAWGNGISSIGKKIAAVSTAIIAPLTAAAGIYAETGTELLRMSQRTGVAVEALSALKQSVAGVDAEGLEKGLRKMQIAIVDAAKGGAEQVKTLRMLGITVNDLIGLSPDQQFLKIGDALSQIHDPALRAALAVQVFGKTGTTLLPAFANGAAGIRDKMRAAADEGRVMTTAQAKQAASLAAAWAQVAKATTAITINLGAAVAPFLQTTAQQLRRIQQVVLDWVQDNQKLIATIFELAKMAFLVGTGLVVLGKAISLLGSGLGLVKTVIGAVGTALSAIVGVLLSLLSPIGLVIAGVTALGAVWAITSQSGQAAIGEIGTAIDDLKEVAGNAFAGIKAALAAGDWSTAASIAGDAIRLAFIVGVNAIMNVWREFRDYFIETAMHAAAGAIKAFAVAWAEIRKGMRSVWESTQEFIAGAIGDLVGVDVTAEVESRKRARAADAAAIDHDTAQFNKEIDAGLHADDNLRDAARKQVQAAAQAEVDAKKKELAALSKQAQAQTGVGKKKREVGQGVAEAMIPDADELNNLLQSKTSARGTFSAVGAGLLGGGGVAQKQLAAAQQANKKLDELKKIDQALLDEARLGGLKFA